MNQGKTNESWRLHCPVPNCGTGDRISLAHGEGGRLMRRLIRERIMTILGGDTLRLMGDAAILPKVDGRLALTTDSFVVSPLFFPGGDIGSLAVYGTVNDLTVSGARPLYITLSLILEEGFPLLLLDQVLKNVARAARIANVTVVAGDTKVVPRGEADGLFINTTGVGQLLEPVPLGPESLCEGDEILVTGPIGCHGIAVLCAREELAMEPPPQSDCAPLIEAADLLRNCLGGNLRAMRDATRGGVAAVLHEWAETSNLTMAIHEQVLPVTPAVRGVCELLGLDPLHIANEGTMVFAVSKGSALKALSVLSTKEKYAQAARIGIVTDRGISPVTVRRVLGNEQPLDDPLGRAVAKDLLSETEWRGAFRRTMPTAAENP